MIYLQRGIVPVTIYFSKSSDFAIPTQYYINSILTLDQVSGTGAQHQRLVVLAPPRDFRLGVAGGVTRQGGVLCLHKREVRARLVCNYIRWHWKR